MEICRTCLRGENLSPIFTRPEQHERYTIALFLTTGLQVEINDGLPQTICKECRELVNVTIDFRNQGRQSEQSLLRWGFRRHSVNTPHERRIRDYYKSVDSKFKGASRNSERPVEASGELKASEDNNFEAEGKNFEVDTKDFEVDYKNFEVDDKSLEVKVKEEISIKVDFDDEPKNEPDSDYARESFHDDDSNETSFNNTVEPRNGDVDKEERRWSDDSFEMEVREKKARKPRQPKGTPRPTIDWSKYSHFSEKPMGLPGPYKCIVCDKILKNKFIFRSHVKLHIGRQIICEFCGMKFANTYLLNRHCMAHHKKECTYKCTMCSFGCWYKDRLQIHVRRAHTGERPFVCDTCGKGFCDRNNIVQHMAVHMTEKNIQCTLCPSRFKTKQQLQCHHTMVHLPRGPRVECPVCHKTYTNMGGVREHCSKIHGIKLPVDNRLKGRRRAERTDNLYEAVAFQDLVQDDSNAL